MMIVSIWFPTRCDCGIPGDVVRTFGPHGPLGFRVECRAGVCKYVGPLRSSPNHAARASNSIAESKRREREAFRRTIDENMEQSMTGRLRGR